MPFFPKSASRSWRYTGKVINLNTGFSTEEKKGLNGADIGFFAILHTWGQKLNLHPHLHCVVPGGGYSPKKKKWIHAPYNYLVPVEVVKKRFRSLFLVKLKELYRADSLFLKDTKWNSSRNFQGLIDNLFLKEWVIYLKESFENRDSVIEYLSRYTHRIAISNHRIVSVKNNLVTFTYRDYKDGNRRKSIQMPVLTFMRRFLLHVLPHRFVRIRYYGILSHRKKKEAVEACREFYNLEKIQKQEVLDWRNIFLRVTGRDVSLCPCCNRGELSLKEVIPPHRYRPPPMTDVQLIKKCNNTAS